MPGSVAATALMISLRLAWRLRQPPAAARTAPPEGGAAAAPADSSVQPGLPADSGPASPSQQPCSAMMTALGCNHRGEAGDEAYQDGASKRLHACGNSQNEQVT